MRRWMILSTAAAALALTVVAQAGADNGQVPFSASFSGTIAFTSPSTTHHVGSGQATHMGNTADDGEVVLSPPDGAGCYPNFNTETLTAANGDQLILQWHDRACPIGPTSFHSNGDWVVVGGTGRFVDATGSGSFAGEADFGPGLSPGTFNLTFTGSISY